MLSIPTEAVEKVLVGENNLLGTQVSADASNHADVFSLNRHLDQYMELLRMVSERLRRIPGSPRLSPGSVYGTDM